MNGEEENLNPDGGNSPELKSNGDDPQLEMDGENAEMDGGILDGAASQMSGMGSRSQADRGSRRGADEDGNGENGSQLGVDEDEDKGDAEKDGDENDEEKKSVSKKEDGEASRKTSAHKSQKISQKKSSIATKQPEKAKDLSKDHRLLWMIKQLEDNLEKFHPAEMWQPGHYQWLLDFLDQEDNRRIFFWIEGDNLEINLTTPSKFNEPGANIADFQMCYFLKRKWDVPITFANIEECIIVGQVDGDPLDDLLNQMNAEFLPKLLGEKNWPEGVKKEFVAQLHKFMAALTEASHASKGRTTLYIPNEDLSDPEAAAKDKDLLQRLESTVIYWTRQIKEVTSNQDSQQSTESTSPLDEIKHWTSRTANLNILNIQLQKLELKKIISVLEIAGSSYLPGFKELEKKIKAGHEEANDNLQFLNTLAEPCRKIENAEPKDIPKILPEVLNSVRIIWELSRFYNTPERMKGLLTKISNQIIKRCRAKINKEDMLDGDVEKCMQDLDESISCCREWKNICLKMQGLIKKYSTRKGWTLDTDETIFAENEAFIQRCKDLKEICEGQLQFARKGANITMPVFGGTKGPEITTNLKDLENMFIKYLTQIKKLDYDILDVKITKWHDDYGQVFKEQIKNLEIIYQNIIALAFKNISTVPDAIEMLENFDSLAKRPMVKDYVHKKAAEWVYKLFMDEIKEVEDMFESQHKKQPPMPISHPKYGGLAIWAQSLIVRIDKAKDAIDTLYFIPEHSHAKEALEKYGKLRSSLDNFIANTQYNSWKKEIDSIDTKNIDDKLEVPILVRSENAHHDLPAVVQSNPLFQRSKKNGLLESNFDVHLLKVLIEVHYWTKIQTLGFVTIPHTVSRLLGRREQLRILRENVMLIVRDYNNIIHTISDKEKSLFKEHLDQLDRTIEPGIKKHNWSATADNFVMACRRECQDVFKKVKRFQKNLLKIYDEFEKMQTTTLTQIQKKLYNLKDFIVDQEECLKQKEKDFILAFEIIKNKMMKTYDLFIYRGPKIQGEWLSFITRLDQKLEKSLKQAVKNSLMDLSKHIRGDSKTDLVPIFKVMSNLDSDDINWRIFYDPTHDELKSSISTFIKKIIHATRIIPRLERVFRDERERKIAVIKKEQEEQEKSGGGGGRFGAANRGSMRNPGDVNFQNMTEEEKEEEWKKRWALPRPMEVKNEFEDKISRNNAINTTSIQILEGIENIQQLIEDDRKLQLASDEYRQLYNIRSDRGRKRILLGSKDALDPDPVQKYKDSIENLNDTLNDIKNKSSQKAEGFIILDSTKLKASLLEQGNKFIQQLFEHLIQESKEDLNSLLKEFVETVEELKTPSTDYAHLKKTKEKYNEVRNKMQTLDARREPIKKKFQYIIEQENDISSSGGLTEEDKTKLAGLDDAWNKFRDGIEEANLIIQKCYAQLKTEMDHSIDDFKKEVQENKKNFQNQAPYSVDKNMDNGKAKEKLQEYLTITKELREKEEEMKFGLEIFDIEPMAYPELSIVEKEISLLTQIWTVKEAWDGEWNKWKQERFYDLNIDMMDDKAVEFQEQIKSFDKEVRQWQIYEYLKNKIDNFRAAMPLIMDLRDEAMRERHWKELRFEVKEDFDENAEDFSLEKVFDLQLTNYPDKISELADNARKELKIEVQLREIKRMWEEDPTTDIDIRSMKSKANNEEYYKIFSTENLYQVIEDHVVKLSNMKSSPYYKQFDDKIDTWENNIAQITETLELLLAVQGKWSYLESIFRGQQDISKQLPSESSIFTKINNDFKIEMERINKERNAYRSLIVKGFIPILVELNKKLEHIQKNLNQFLEGKRSLFPRFYFLSNDDLLEIIGQAKDPEPIQKHIKKIFEGIASLKFNQQGRGMNKTYEITTLVSPEKEEVEIKQVLVDARVEQWLKSLMDAMKEALRKIFFKFYQENMGSTKKLPEREKLLKLIRNTQGQVLITCAQMQWTIEVTNALLQLEQSGQVNALKKARQTYKKKVENYVELVEKPGLTLLERLKLISLITIEEHNREVIERIYAQKIQSPRHFEWLQQLRFKRANDENEQLYIQIDQTNCTFDYGYEYQGNNGRLVVTPLTDRAYMTLTNALNMCRGGAPQGPAGTGKTETVKDLGKNLAFFVVIQNCSDTMDFASLGKTFAGLALSGSWGCFDEFNRIELEVLSVVAQQIQTILDAIKKSELQTSFEGQTIQVMKDCGIFITMNPGYAGRTELPDNLKSLFRPVAMMVPDFNTIAKIILMSEGFKQNEPLAKKVVTIYELMKKQLSKQDHYDFGMRAVKSVLNAAGRVKRERPDLDEFTVMIKAIRDMNLPKFIAEDVVLFDNLFIDLFPGCDEPDNDCDDLLIALEDSLKKNNLQLNENLVVKILQLYESKVTRHGNMLVGVSMSGKTTCWKILAEALNILNQEEKDKGVKAEDCKYPGVKWESINPKSINTNELFGFFDDANPPQWHDGILSSILKRICLEAKNDHRWMVLDGPVDTLWIESMNSVLDDNKLLTLNNGDRIGLSPNVRLLFEVQDLSVASPATVSRAGMIYLDIEELGYRPLVDQWIAGKQGDEYKNLLDDLFNKYVPKVLKVKKTQCKELVQTSESACVLNLSKLFDSLCKNLKKADDEDQDTFFLYVEKWFVFCLIWSIGATVEEQSRREIDYILRDIESMFPHSNTVYEHYINSEKKDWASWEEKLQANWKPVDKEFHKINVPTIDTVRNRFIVQSLLDNNSQVLLVGHSGVGKTVLVEGILLTLDTHIHYFTINFSAGTTSENTQEIIESNFERRAKNKYRPKNAKVKAICFIDDLNMPRKDTFGSQPPLELIRQWMDYEFWYDRTKITQNQICDLQILSAMGKPGGGRAEISKRLQSKFHIVNYTIPTEAQMRKIFETIAQFKFQTFDEEIKNLSEPLAIATINLFNIIQENFLPTPAKSHYIFNMRDISKVFQGIYLADRNFYEGKEHIIKLWAHEILRVFSDRLIAFEDRDTFKSYLNEQLELHFQMNYKEHCQTNGEDAVFVDFLNENMKVYEEVTNFDKLREYLMDQLESYNSQPKLIKMDLVLFKDAITHIAKIYRVLNLKRGHCFLVGVGGSGRHSLTKLSAFISEMNVFQLEVTKGFALRQFREFLKNMYEVAAYKGKNKLKTVFIFSDNDVVQESFLEDVNNMLSAGFVPNLYIPDELAKIREEIRRPYKQAGGTVDSIDALNEFFFNRVKDNLHISICMSPIGQAFRDYCRMYPALINNTNINWFMRWPDDALTEVAMKFVGQMDLTQDLKPGLARLCSFSHSTCIESASMMQKELRRIFYVTPTNYIELLKGYNQILTQKRKEVGGQIQKLRNGLQKLDDARKQVEEMTQESEVKRAEVSKQQKICEDLMINVSKEQRNADEQQKKIESEKVRIEKEKEETEKLAADAEAELKKAEPALLAAQEALESLDKKYIAEIKSFASPPADVATVMSAVMIVLGKDPTWQSVKKELADPKFVDRIMNYDKENISQKTMKAIEKYTKQENFQPAYVKEKSMAAGALCMWVRSLEDYAKALKVVGPKRDKKQYAEEQLRKKIEYLQKLEEEYQELADRLAELTQTLDKTNTEMAIYKRELEDLQTKIDRGDKLITGLSGEKIRWEASLIELDDQYAKLVGDCILAAAFMSYCGPFPSDYRNNLNQNWISTVEIEKIPFTTNFDFSEFMAGQAMAREWQINGLPTDKFSFENGVLVTRGLRWALNIDPQSQANNWIKKMEGDTLVIADFKDTNYIKKIELGIVQGKQVLFQDVEQEMDPVLDNVLNKSIIMIGKKAVIKLGGNDIEYNKNFKLYITTRMSNPHYTPEVSTKVCLVNFTVVESGLEEQCLGIVVKKEQPNLEQTKNDVVQKIANNKKMLIELEDKILRMLSESKVNLLEDVTLIATLQTSKETSDEVKQSLEQSEQTMKRIDDTRETYRPCGKVASILFFVLNDLNKIDPMYQFSLDWYKRLFQKSIEDSKEQGYGDRIKNIIKTHQLAVYRQACRSLFEKHKLLLSLQMCVKLKMSDNEINEDEWTFFLRGGQVMDRSTQPPKPPFDWITSGAWDNVTELEKMLPETFIGIANAITLNPKEWQRWFLSTKPEPENAPLPGEWETKCEDRLKKMIVLRCLRPDRVLFAIRNFVENYKKELVENKPTQLQEVYDESQSDTPIIFVLSPGVDPSEQLKKFAEKQNQKIESISLGKGQSEKAKRILTEGADKGNWVFLANCHLSISLLPELESIIDLVFKQHNDPNFRLFLSASPHPKFPISLLQRSIKVTQEPPKGIKANMLRLYDNMGTFQDVDQDKNFRKAVYGLCWFHSVLIERKKFKTLGWNVSYAFNDSDYSVCEDLLAIYMGRLKDGKPAETYDKRAQIPWQAIQYLIAEANYGGRITDDRDRRLIKVYAKEIFNENLVLSEKWKPVGTEELTYGYPADEQNAKHPDQAALFTPDFFYDEILTKMEPIDQPIAFGQHVNAEITSQILDSNELLDSILSLQPQKVSAEGDSREDKVLKLISDLQENVPQQVDVWALKYKFRNDDNPLNVVLVQELHRYNILLNVLLTSLEQLERGIKGFVVISPELEQIMQSLFENKVPKQWGFAFFSLKPLAIWIRDLNERYKFFADWAAKSAPFVFWISAFTYPTGFTTSLLQRYSRRHQAAIDKLEFDFLPLTKPLKDIAEHAKDGCYITGLYLEGAKWNPDKQCLMEPDVMELQTLMPVLHFKPIPKRAKPPQNMYECPCYYYPVREGTIDKDSFMLKIDLKTGEQPPEFWIKRGTALLMSTGS